MLVKLKCPVNSLWKGYPDNHGGVRGVMVIVIGNEHCAMSSNPGPS